MSPPEIEEFFAEIRGRQCWSVIGGGSGGSVISLRFGERVPLKKPLTNAALSMEERLFDGERSLIIYCAWRLEAGREILCSSQSVSDEGSLDVSALGRIRNEVVAEAGFTSPFHDLRIAFGGDVVLSAFCDLAPLSDESNYVMFNPATSIAVTATGLLLVEGR
jgi:hypothetical protein